jgi:hypothetical protein
LKESREERLEAAIASMMDDDPPPAPADKDREASRKKEGKLAY